MCHIGKYQECFESPRLAVVEMGIRWILKEEKAILAEGSTGQSHGHIKSGNVRAGWSLHGKGCGERIQIEIVCGGLFEPQ